MDQLARIRLAHSRHTARKCEVCFMLAVLESREENKLVATAEEHAKQMTERANVLLRQLQAQEAFRQTALKELQAINMFARAFLHLAADELHAAHKGAKALLNDTALVAMKRALLENAANQVRKCLEDGAAASVSPAPRYHGHAIRILDEALSK